MAREFRDPCPMRIWTDIGGAFTMGFVAGTLWNGYKGFRNAPKGDGLKSSFIAVRSKAPLLGGQFAVWGGLFSTFDCTLIHLRGTDDAKNSIAAAFLTGSLLAARQGLRPALSSGVMGALILGIIEGVTFWVGNIAQKTQLDQMQAQQSAAGFGAAPAAVSRVRYNNDEEEVYE